MNAKKYVISINSPSISLPSCVIPIVSPTFMGCWKKSIKQAVTFERIDISAKSATPKTVKSELATTNIFSCYTLQMATSIILNVTNNKRLIIFRTSFFSVFLKYEFNILRFTKYLNVNLEINNITVTIKLSIICIL